MREMFAARRDRVQKQIADDSVDAVLVSSEVNVRYLTGFTGDSSVLIATAKEALIVSDGRYTTQLRDECPDIEAEIRPPAKSLALAVGETLESLGVRTVAFDAADMHVADLETIKDAAKSVDWKSESGRIETYRAIKDDWELGQIRDAIRIAERAYAMFLAMLRGKDTEKELTDNLEMYLRRAGAECSSFPPIVASGPRAALPHAQGTSHRLDEENLLLLDWGASGPERYKSDLTRVLFRRRKEKSSAANDHDKLREVYSVVAEAQQAAISQLRPGAMSGDVDKAARSTISDAGYNDYFTHSIGHGIGLQIHEAPFMRPNGDVEIKEGMIVTVEPGIYLPDWGGVRLEDDVLVTEDGPVVLSSVTKEFDEQAADW